MIGARRFETDGTPIIRLTVDPAARSLREAAPGRRRDRLQLLAGEHLECEPAAELALEGECEPESCECVDEVERVESAEPDGSEPDVRDQPVGDLRCTAFLGCVEEVGVDAVEDRIGEVLPAERVERATG